MTFLHYLLTRSPETISTGQVKNTVTLVLKWLILRYVLTHPETVRTGLVRSTVTSDLRWLIWNYFLTGHNLLNWRDLKALDSFFVVDFFYSFLSSVENTVGVHGGRLARDETNGFPPAWFWRCRLCGSQSLSPTFCAARPRNVPGAPSADWTPSGCLRPRWPTPSVDNTW